MGAAKIVVLTERPSIEDDTSKLDDETLDTLLAHMGTVASVFHKPPEMFLKEGKTGISLKSHSVDKKARESESESSSSSDEESDEESGDESEDEGDDEEDEEDEEEE